MICSAFLCLGFAVKIAKAAERKKARSKPFDLLIVVNSVNLNFYCLNTDWNGGSEV